MLTVACLQLNSGQNVPTNLTHIEAGIKTAAHSGAQLVVLPENACSMGRQHQLATRFDELSAKMAAFAEQYGVHLVAGTLPCPYRPDGSKVSNNKLRQASQLFAPDGTCVARYDKIHLFKATVNDSHGSYDEGATFEAGTQVVVAPISSKNGMYYLGLMVCFDLRFAALAQRLRQAGAQLLSAPSAFTYQTGKAHWRLLLQARGLDSQCMVLGAAQGGMHLYQNGDKPNSHRQTWGHAAITDFNGECVSEYPYTDLNPVPNHQTNHQTDNNIIATEHFSVVMATLDETKQQQARQQLPLIHCHRLA